MSYKKQLSLAALASALTLALAGTVSAAPAAPGAPGAKPERIRGTIVSYAGEVLTLHRRSGDTVTIDLKQDIPVGAVKKIKLAEVKPGSFIGTAATTGVDGKMTATEVLVFPESARGTGEGHYAWDLGPHSTMTNANVDSVVKGNSGRTLTLSYKGGTNDVIVPPNVPIVTFAPASRADLTAGKKVFAVATAGSAGHYTALRVVVEKDGVAPPM